MTGFGLQDSGGGIQTDWRTCCGRWPGSLTKGIYRLLCRGLVGDIIGSVYNCSKDFWLQGLDSQPQSSVPYSMYDNVENWVFCFYMSILYSLRLTACVSIQWLLIRCIVTCWYVQAHVQNFASSSSPFKLLLVYNAPDCLWMFLPSFKDPWLLLIVSGLFLLWGGAHLIPGLTNRTAVHYCVLSTPYCIL